MAASMHRTRLLVVGFVLLAPTTAYATWSADSVSGNNPLVTTAEYQFAPAAASDGAGGMIVVWVDPRGSDGSHDLYAQRISAEGVPLWVPGGVLVCGAIRDQDQPAIVSDGVGGAIVVWRDQREFVFPSPRSQIRAQRLDPNGARCWTADGVLVCGATSTRGTPVLVSDNALGAYVAWIDFRGDSDIYAQRILPDGGTPWTADGVPVCTATSTQSGLAIAREPTGTRLALAWQDLRSGTYTVYVQVLTSSGAPLFAANGRPADEEALGTQLGPAVAMNGDALLVCWSQNQTLFGIGIDVVTGLSTFGVTQLVTGSGNKTSARLLNVGTSELLIWQDYRAGATADLYARRLFLMVPQGLSTGTPICTSAGDQINVHAVVSTELGGNFQGGAVIAWQDRRTGSWDIRAQWITPDAVPHWTANGRLVSEATGDQTNPSVVASEIGLLCAWTDTRAGNGDIYAQYVDPNGVVGDTEPKNLEVGDVLGDHGGHVALTWDRCTFDTGGLPGISSYVIRRLSAGAWQPVDTIPATGASQYTVDVATPADSGAAGPANQHFRIVAQTPQDIAQPRPLWSSAPDSGHSVDDLALADVAVDQGAGPFLHSIAPNPATRSARLVFTLPRAGLARLELLDAAGRRVRSWSGEWLPAGRHVRDVVLDAGESAPVEPGRYVVRLTFDGLSVARTLSITR